MKKKKLFAILLLVAVCAGCGAEKEQTTMVTVDIATEHSEKEVVLQDFMDVEYIPLETSDEFVTQGSVMDIGDKYLLVKNWANDGDIFVYDRKTGKAIRKINRKGQGAEEYNFINGIILDENNDEMFVNCAAAKKIYVYDLSGNFKRSFAHPKDTEYMDVLNYDKDNLICYDASVYYKDGQSREEGKSYHSLISKKDRSVTRDIYLPYDIIKTPCVHQGDGVAMTSVRPIIPNRGEWLLVDCSSDTVYNYVPEKNKLVPFFVKAPTKDPEILLTMGAVTDRYYFLHTVKKEFDFTTGRGFFMNDFMYDKQTNELYKAKVLNSDFVKKRSVDMFLHPINNNGIAAVQTLSAGQLVEAYQEDGLKGRLKEVAAGLDEESNPVVMLVKYKN